MPLTPETLVRHELNGLHTEVVDSPNPDLIGVAGRVVVETMRTLHLDDGDRVRQVPKEGTTFEFRLPRTTTTTTTEDPTADTDRDGGDVPTVAPDTGGRPATDEAAGAAKDPGTTSKPVSQPTEPATDADSNSTDEVGTDRAEAGEGVAYVTVDGTRLLSRPALRTENAGEPTWR
jgi:ribonuclease P protein subunit POP4